MCHFFLLARVKCKYSLGSNAPSSRLSRSLAQLISQASRIFLWCQLLLVLRIVASFHAISEFVFITWSASADFFVLSPGDSLLVLSFSCYEFFLRFANVTLAAISARNVVNSFVVNTSFVFVHLVFRFWKHLAYCLIGFECHSDAVVFQNSLYWLRGPTDVRNCAVPPFGLCTRSHHHHHFIIYTNNMR